MKYVRGPIKGLEAKTAANDSYPSCEALLACIVDRMNVSHYAAAAWDQNVIVVMG